MSTGGQPPDSKSYDTFAADTIVIKKRLTACKYAILNRAIIGNAEIEGNLQVDGEFQVDGTLQLPGGAVIDGNCATFPQGVCIPTLSGLSPIAVGDLLNMNAGATVTSLVAHDIVGASALGTFVVDLTGQGPVTSLQQAVDLAVASGGANTILLPGGTYTAPGGVLTIPLVSKLTIIGISNSYRTPQAVIISARIDISGASTVVNFQDVEITSSLGPALVDIATSATSLVTFHGCNLEAGENPAIRHSGDVLLKIDNNSIGGTPAILTPSTATGGDVEVQNCLIRGGIIMNARTAVISSSKVLTGGFATTGLTAVGTGAFIQIANSSVGSGIIADDGGFIRVNNCTVNTSGPTGINIGGSGGASVLEIANCYMSGSTSTYWATAETSGTIVFALLSFNTAPTMGSPTYVDISGGGATPLAALSGMLLL